MKPKIGRPPSPPVRGGTMHLVGKWENRLWLYKEAITHSLSQSQIFDEVIETVRLKHKRYNPQKLVDALSWEDDVLDDVPTYDKRIQVKTALVSKVEKKIKDLDSRRSV